MKDDSSMQENSATIQVKNSLGKLHNAVSQALSHPNEKISEQAENSLAHSERAVSQTDRLLGNQGVELAEEILSEEKQRFSRINKNNNRTKN